MGNVIDNPVSASTLRKRHLMGYVNVGSYPLSKYIRLTNRQIWTITKLTVQDSEVYYVLGEQVHGPANIPAERMYGTLDKRVDAICNDLEVAKKWQGYLDDCTACFYCHHQMQWHSGNAYVYTYKCPVCLHLTNI